MAYPGKPGVSWRIQGRREIRAGSLRESLSFVASSLCRRNMILLFPFVERRLPLGSNLFHPSTLKVLSTLSMILQILLFPFMGRRLPLGTSFSPRAILIGVESVRFEFTDPPHLSMRTSGMGMDTRHAE